MRMIFRLRTADPDRMAEMASDKNGKYFSTESAVFQSGKRK